MRGLSLHISQHRRVCIRMWLHDFEGVKHATDGATSHAVASGQSPRDSAKGKCQQVVWVNGIYNLKLKCAPVFRLAHKWLVQLDLIWQAVTQVFIRPRQTGWYPQHFKQWNQFVPDQLRICHTTPSSGSKGKSYNKSFNMDYKQRRKFTMQAAAAVVCAIGVTALICMQAPDLESDEDWEIDSTTAEMAQSVISVCLLYIWFSSSVWVAHGSLSSLWTC